jgi:hypothetical protein
MSKIGTDIYLSFDKQTKKEKDAQITGFDINAGKFGYLRASIGMTKENNVLRLLFPENFWHGGVHLYDFESNFLQMMEIVLVYLKDDKLPDPEQKNYREQLEHGNRVKEAVKSIIGDAVEIKLGADSEDMRFRVTWSKSLSEFFELGRKMQKAGRRPKVHISW